MPLWQRLIRYGLVGASGVGVSSGVLQLVWGWLHPWWSSAPFAVATESAILTNFVLNSYFTFRQRPSFHALWRYNLVSVAGGVAQVLVSGLVTRMGVYHLWAYWAGIPVNTAIGFVLSLLWVFRAEEPKDVPAETAQSLAGSPGPDR
jgi:putative flippase GtrA